MSTSTGAWFTAACSGCGTTSPNTEPAPDGGVDARPPKPQADASSESVPQPPAGLVPTGWELHRDYDPTCGFYAPGSAAFMPAPNRWEPCAVAAGSEGVSGPAGIDCRRVAPDWRPRYNDDTMLVSGSGRTPDGRLLFALKRIYDGVKHEELVVEPDGPVHQAMISVGRCGLGPASIRADKIVYRVIEDLASLSQSPGGAIGGRVDELPRTLVAKGYKPNDIYSHVFVAGATMFVESNGVADSLRSFLDGRILGSVVKSGYDYQFSGDDLFWQAEVGAALVIRTKPATGDARTLVPAPNGDGSIAGFATDGVDMAWTEAAGRMDGSAAYATHDLWTAKFTTDPTVLAATRRRVRSTSRKTWADTRVVGCGYAAQNMVGDAAWPQLGVRLVRLSDGRTWDVLANNEAQTYALSFARPHAITCEELFVDAVHLSYSGLARIRLDSLGPGTAPD